MVSQAYGHHGDKRHNRAFSPYVGSSGYAEARVYIPPPPDTRSLMSEHQSERAETPTRKRIAVACGRCRQRKIRCSGDLGQNIPCSNCKNAGVTQCLFLRVSSRETSIKGDLGLGTLGNLGTLGSYRNEYNYNPVVARALATRSAVPPPSYGPSTTSTTSTTSTSPSPTSTTSPGASASGHDFDYRSPLYPYKSYLSNMTPWGAGYGEDCVDYTIPSCNSYSVVNVNDTATSPGGVSTGHLVAYQPWDSRGKQPCPNIETHSPTMPSGTSLLPTSMPSAVPPPLSQGLQTAVTSKTLTPAPAAPVQENSVTNSGRSTSNNPTTSLVYRLASSTDTGDYRHTSSPLDGDLPRNSVEGIDRLPAEPLGNMSRYKVRELIARSAAPSPAPCPHVIPHHSMPHSIPHSIPHSVPHSVPSSLPHGVPHSIPHNASHSASQSMPPPPLSPYTGHIHTASSDRVTALGYPVSTCSSPVDHSVYGTNHSSSTIPDGGLFSEQDRSAGTQGSAGGPSSSASCLESYTYEPSSSKTMSAPSAVGMTRQKSKKAMTPATSTENLTKASSTLTTRVYSPTEGPALPPMSRPSSPALYMPPHQDARNDSVYVGGQGHSLQLVQHTSHRG
ncbi:hypothetical protein SBRCBS47491_006227 [Sporothrix bragantina]|uniref:Zn(2)-C6 fungal-type domain-containing protein n=1 Tax=Sporothrix bragantina TaxID=671064 RepID=A0ABP0C563_9PEZI